MFYNQSSFTVGKLFVLLGITLVNFSTPFPDTSNTQHVAGFVTSYSLLQMCLIAPSIVLPCSKRSITTYFTAETILILAMVFVGVGILPEQYKNMYAIFMVLHISSCQMNALISGKDLLKCGGFVQTTLTTMTVIFCGSMLVFCPTTLIPEIALAMFVGEIVGVVVAVMCSVFGMISVWYENMYRSTN